jgi:hypothetical protein
MMSIKLVQNLYANHDQFDLSILNLIFLVLLTTFRIKSNVTF